MWGLATARRTVPKPAFTLQHKVLDNSCKQQLSSKIMSNVQPIRPLPEPPALHDRAMDNLRFIRETMERASAFTAVPGWGMVVIGMLAMLNAQITTQVIFHKSWLFSWLGLALASVLISFIAMYRKAKAADSSLFSTPAKKFVLSLAPPLFAGALLTIVIWQVKRPDLLPGMWLLLYGTGVVTGGAFSVKIIPVMGICFMVFGAITLFSPFAWGNYLMALGFGVMHIIFGIIIARKHGG